MKRRAHALRQVPLALLQTLLSLFLGAALAALLAAPALAEKPSGKKGSDERAEWCAINYNVCTDIGCAWGWEVDDDLKTLKGCYDECFAEYNKCFDAPRVGGRLGEVFNPHLSPGVLDEDDLGISFPVGSLSEPTLEQACTRVPTATFLRAGNAFGCTNPCTPDGSSCSVVCIGGKCSGLMEDPPSGKLTLIAILQNGDPVVKGGGAAGGTGLSTPGSEGQPCSPDNKACY